MSYTNLSQKLLLLVGIISGGVFLTCGGNIIVAPWFGLNPDSPGVLESWFPIWKIEIIIASLLGCMYVFYFHERMTELQKNLLKKLWKFSFPLIFLLVFLSPIIAGVVLDYIRH